MNTYLSIAVIVCIQLALSMLNVHQSTVGHLELKRQSETKGSIKFLLIGGASWSTTGGSGAADTFEVYYPDMPQKSHVLKTKLHRWRDGHRSFLINQKVYTVGGDVKIPGHYDNFNYYVTSGCETLDPASNEVSVCPYMMQNRSYAGGAILHGKPYMCGGIDDDTARLSSCERYNIALGTWEFVKGLDFPRIQMGMVSLGDHLYVIGGEYKNLTESYPNYYSLKTLTRYTPNTNSWTDMQPMNEIRAKAGAAAFQGKIYVCGGFKEIKTEYPNEWAFSCERYDPKTDKWTFISSLNNRQSFFDLVSTKDRLFAFGGFDNDNKVEEYDPKKNKWTLLEHRLIEGRGRSAVVLLPS